MCVVYLWEQKQKDMQTVNFFKIEILDTTNPEWSLTGVWYGRANITQETDYDDQDQPFTVDVAEITNLFFTLATDGITKAKRVEIPHPSYKGQMFIAHLKQAAIAAYHNPELQPAEMPDDELQYTPKPGDTVIFPTITAEDLKEARIADIYADKVIDLVGKSVEVFFVDTNEYNAPFEKGYFEINDTSMLHGIIFPLKWLRK